MRCRMWLSGCLAVVVSSALLAWSSAQGAAPDIGPDTSQRHPYTADFDIWTMNISGATASTESGEIYNGGSPDAVWPIISYINAGFRPDAIALQEVCSSGLEGTPGQLETVRSHLQAVGYAVHWRKVRDQPRCQASNGTFGTGLGDLIAVPQHQAVEAFQRDFTPDVPGESGEGLTCFSFVKMSRWFVACSTQISGTDAEEQYKTFRMHKDLVKPLVEQQNVGVVIAGDFNSNPGQSTMNNMYDSSYPQGNGLLFEADCSASCRDGEWTHVNRTQDRRKIDYIFFSGNQFKPRTTRPAFEKWASSYHRFYATNVAMNLG
jgi:hypothetical protein